jgi:hypothetical protein
MMTLADVAANPPPLETLRGLAIVFAAQFIEALMLAQDGFILHRVQPITLQDGSLMLCADVLSEAHGGIFADQFQRLDQSLFSEVEIIPMDEIQQLMPISSLEP